MTLEQKFDQEKRRTINLNQPFRLSEADFSDIDAEGNNQATLEIPGVGEVTIGFIERTYTKPAYHVIDRNVSQGKQSRPIKLKPELVVSLEVTTPNAMHSIDKVGARLVYTSRQPVDITYLGLPRQTTDTLPNLWEFQQRY